MCGQQRRRQPVDSISGGKTREKLRDAETNRIRIAAPPTPGHQSRTTDRRTGRLFVPCLSALAVTDTYPDLSHSLIADQGTFSPHAPSVLRYEAKSIVVDADTGAHEDSGTAAFSSSCCFHSPECTHSPSFVPIRPLSPELAARIRLCRSQTCLGRTGT